MERRGRTNGEETMMDRAVESVEAAALDLVLDGTHVGLGSGHATVRRRRKDDDPQS